ncbi:MAG TPA: DHH family phosphoesterase [Candidatus Paceibacterota bacterium]|nr:DHH family phosphoesterase [Candidatus Paceibacterota bacterium]
MDTFRTAFWSLVSAAPRVVITAHFSPDDDSIASVLSVYTILTKRFPEKSIRIVYTGEKVERYSVFHNFEKIEWTSDIADHVHEIDLLIVLDVSNFSRISHLDTAAFSTIPQTIAIDHHASPPDRFTLSFVDPTFSSNAQLIYTLLEAEKYLSKELAELFLLGILGDTGNLTHIASTQTEIFLIVKKLVEVGDIRIDSFLSKFRAIPKRIMPLLQEFVRNTTFDSVGDWGAVQYSFVSRPFIVEHQFSDEDISAASHMYLSQYLPRIEGQPWGFVCSPRSDGGTRMSSRSNAGSINVRLLHEALGVGGGHDRASGGNFPDAAPEACIQHILEWMKTNTPTIG